MFQTCQNFTMKNKKVALAFLLIIWNIFTIGETVSAGDNDKVKAGGKDFVNVKLV